MTKKTKSTYDTFIESLTDQQKTEFENEYREFLISEMLIAAMEEDDLSVRKLAELANVSPTIIQGIRSGDKQNITVKTFSKILKSMGYSLVVEKDGSRFPLNYRR